RRPVHPANVWDGLSGVYRIPFNLVARKVAYRPESILLDGRLDDPSNLRQLDPGSERPDRIPQRLISRLDQRLKPRLEADRNRSIRNITIDLDPEINLG